MYFIATPLVVWLFKSHPIFNHIKYGAMEAIPIYVGSLASIRRFGEGLELHTTNPLS